MMTQEQILHIETRLKDEYRDSEVCMAEYLASRSPEPEMSLEDCTKVYCDLINWADQDEFYRVAEGEQSSLISNRSHFEGEHGTVTLSADELCLLSGVLTLAKEQLPLDKQELEGILRIEKKFIAQTQGLYPDDYSHSR